MKTTIRTAAALLLAGLAAGAHALPADQLFAKVAPSIWRVFVFNEKGSMLGQGSAVVVAPETLLTNCHVVGPGRAWQIKKDNQAFDARLQYMDPQRDLCQITVRNLKAPALPLGDSDRLSTGQKVYALGNPLGLELTFSDGLISSLRKDDEQRLATIQITAPISPGSSGGALLDDEGRLIGITTAHYVNGQNLNLAIPVNWMRDLPARSEAYVNRRAAELKVPAQVQLIAAADAILAARKSEADAKAVADAKARADAEAKTALEAKALAEAKALVEARALAEAKAQAELRARAQPAAPAPAPVVAQAVAVAAPAASGMMPTSVAAAPAGERPPAVSTGFLVPIASGYARIADLAKLDEFAAREGYKEYLRTPYPRAFAITKAGNWFTAWGVKPRTGGDPDPAKRVVADCEAYHQKRCYIYAVNDTVVFRPEQK
jgi:serine protease Do